MGDSVLAVELTDTTSAERPFPRPVVCKWCKNRYRSVVPTEVCKGLQGDGCTVSVVQDQDGRWYAEGHYGSTDYDCRRFVFVDNVPREPADPVCDNCVGERIEAGDLVEDLDDEDKVLS